MKIIEDINPGFVVFHLEKDGHRLATLATSISNDTLIITETKGQILPDLNFEDEGRMLVMYAVNYAMEKNLKIKASCPFALSIFQSNPQISDRLNK